MNEHSDRQGLYSNFMLPEDTAVVDRVAALLAAGSPVPRDDMAAAARAVAGELATRRPGKSIEVRVPPYAAVQVGLTSGDGPTHRRGTPPNVVELAPETSVRLATGDIAWSAAVKGGLVRYSGAHAGEVAGLLPLR